MMPGDAPDKDEPAEWSSYWQGRHAASSLEAVNVETNERIAEFWASSLSSLDRNARFVDLACGSGTVAAHASKLGFTNITAVDASREALALVRERVPTARVERATLPNDPLPEGPFDIVVSQFGLEYGGEAAFDAALRCLAPNGQAIFLVHLAGGGIAQECEGHLRFATSILESMFIPTAKNFITAAKTEDAGQADSSDAMEIIKAFQHAERKVAQFSTRRPGSLATHLHGGFRQLFERRNHYDLADITNWLDGMEAEVTAYADRMSGMLGAAFSENRMAALCDRAEALTGCRPAIEKFAAGSPDPIAWTMHLAVG